MKIIAIDEGNTLVKAGLFDGGNLTQTHVAIDLKGIALMLDTHPDAVVIYSSVRNGHLPEALEKRRTAYMLIAETPLPFAMRYGSPTTLGHDRKAAVAGLMHFFPGEPALAINMGTCITFDVLAYGNEYPGGIISPGLRMRYKAMHEFTAALPDLEPMAVALPGIGNTTETCMHYGVIGGIKAEIEARITELQVKYPTLKIVISGGDAPFISQMLSTHLLLQPHLNLWGLHRILSHLLEIQE